MFFGTVNSIENIKNISISGCSRSGRSWP